MAEMKVPARRADLLFGSPSGVSLLKVSDLPDNAQICNCNGVSKKQIVDAIQNQGCQSVSKVGACTRAGMRLRFVQEPGGADSGILPRRSGLRPDRTLLRAGNTAGEIAARFRNSQSRHQVRQRSLFAAWRKARKIPASKVGLASLLKTLWPGEYEDERDARFINDRVHANIQKDGTFSVVPRIYGGVTTRG